MEKPSHTHLWSASSMPQAFLSPSHRKNERMTSIRSWDYEQHTSTFSTSQFCHCCEGQVLYQDLSPPQTLGQVPLMPNMGQWGLQQVSSVFVQTPLSVAACIGFKLLHLVIFDPLIACLRVKRCSIPVISLFFSECSL